MFTDATLVGVACALYGLQCMSADVPEVRQLLAKLSPKIASSVGEFRGQDIAMACYGFQAMTPIFVTRNRNPQSAGECYGLQATPDLGH